MLRDYQKLRKQDVADAERMARSISPYLHHSINQPNCPNPLLCLLCTNAARLAVQHYRPIIEKRVVESLMENYNVSCTLPHPGGD